LKSKRPVTRLAASFLPGLRHLLPAEELGQYVFSLRLRRSGMKVEKQIPSPSSKGGAGHSLGETAAMILRVALVLLPPSLASCDPSSTDRAWPPSSALAERPDCGMNFVIRRHIPRPGSGESRVQSGGAVPACALPTDADVSAACREEEGVSIPGSRNPDYPNRPQYAFPDYTVRSSECAYLDSTRSSADCAFDLVGRQNGRERVTARLHHRFRDLSDEIAHDYFWVGWEVDSVCKSAGSNMSESPKTPASSESAPR
jgi:hypothetical protein